MNLDRLSPMLTLGALFTASIPQLAFAQDTAPGMEPERQPTSKPVPAPGDSVYSEEALRGLVLGTPEIGVELHGFVNLEYYAFQNDADHPVNSFDIHNVFLSSQAHVGSLVRLFVELEYEHGSTVKLDRAFLDFDIASPLTLRVGRFSPPLSYERIHYAAPVRLMTSRPMMVDVAFHEWTDTGVMAYGRVGLVGYNLAVLDGPRGLTEQGIPDLNVVDINPNKTVLGRFNIYPSPSFEGGAAASAGTYDPQNQRWFYLAELDARYHQDRWDVWAEAQYRDGADEPCNGNVDSTCNPSYAGDHAHKFGYYVLASYVAVRGRPYVHYLKPILRFDELDDLEAKTGQRRITAGLNWSPISHVVVKSELQSTFPTSQLSVASYGLMMSAVADF